MKNEKNINNLNLSVSLEVAEGHYSNLAIITHSPTEFILDFAQMLPGTQNNSVVRSRILMHPVHAKRLLMALQDNIEKYEDTYGDIREIDAPQTASGNYNDIIPHGEA